MRHPEIMHFRCDECGNVLSDFEVDEGRCIECNGKFTAVAVFYPRDPQPVRLNDAD